MRASTTRSEAKHHAIHRKARKISLPQGNKVSEFFGENCFNIFTEKGISGAAKNEINAAIKEGRPVANETVELIAKTVTDWAVNKGVTHFCHWFQPLTGNTAEKHDAFLSLKNGQPIEKLSTNQLIQGEPDASSFPNGGSRSTFEARGYTSWDFTSPFFIMEGDNGKTLCIPTAFVTYHGDALDVKTPLLRSISRVSELGTKFLHIIGEKNVNSLQVNCGGEQEYFLVDKSFYYLRPDLTMTGRTLHGSLPAKNQQLDDHYFAAIPERVLSFMQELEYELYKLGIPAKTRHNEVAPGQFELAPIFENANIASDHAQVVMALIKKTALKHDFVALLHEKPFASVNGSGKHMNWSLSTDEGSNLFEPGDKPQDNARFLAIVAITLEAVHRHAGALRMAVATHGNDHRLGANEAPPSVISAFLGDTLGKIFHSLAKGEEFTPEDQSVLDLGTHQLMNLKQDNTDRNRTSPFAFTGNKFEFRAVGSSQNVGFPLTILNTAVADVLEDSIEFLEKEINGGKKAETALLALTKKWAIHAEKIIFNGDGYSDEWLEEAAERGLPNLRTTADALALLKDSKATEFLAKQKVLNQAELEMRYNVLIEKYITHREIEFETLGVLVSTTVLPASFAYKSSLGEIIDLQKRIGQGSTAELEIYKELVLYTDKLWQAQINLEGALKRIHDQELGTKAKKIADELMPLSEEVARWCNKLENIVPDSMWNLPKYYDMLFVR